MQSQLATDFLEKLGLPIKRHGKRADDVAHSCHDCEVCYCIFTISVLCLNCDSILALHPSLVRQKWFVSLVVHLSSSASHLLSSTTRLKCSICCLSYHKKKS